MGVDKARIEAAVAEILAAIGEDAGRPGLESTPQRVADAYGEFFAGVALLVTAAFYLTQLYVYQLRDRFTPVTNSAVALVALIGGAFMSINFWFAAGWLSVSTDSVNLVMALMQVVLAVATIALLAVVNKPTNVWDEIFTPEPKTKVFEREHELVR